MKPEFATHLRALLIALGLYAAGALVWFGGPLVSFDGIAPLEDTSVLLASSPRAPPARWSAPGRRSATGHQCPVDSSK